jgi:hypothetical protein
MGKTEKEKRKIRNDARVDFKNELKLNSPCAACGETNIILLDFAHFDRKNKKYSLRASISIESLKKELPKGRFLCLWCHRLETDKETKTSVCKKIEDYRYSDEENNREPDDTLKRCDGPVCKGLTRHPENFYNTQRWSNHCKICKRLQDKLKRVENSEYIKQCKIDVGSCNMCNRIVTMQTTVCFDYDHINRDDKYKTIAFLTKQGRSKKTLDKEVKKCQLLCCNCHRLKTHKEFGWNVYSEK